MLFNTDEVKSSACVVSHERSDEGQEAWIRFYAQRVFSTWGRVHPRLDLATDYLECIKQDLAAKYRNPLLKKFVEATY